MESVGWWVAITSPRWRICGSAIKVITTDICPLGTLGDLQRVGSKTEYPCIGGWAPAIKVTARCGCWVVPLTRSKIEGRVPPKDVASVRFFAYREECTLAVALFMHQCHPVGSRLVVLVGAKAHVLRILVA